jgi:hypothetical protein
MRMTVKRMPKGALKKASKAKPRKGAPASAKPEKPKAAVTSTREKGNGKRDLRIYRPELVEIKIPLQKLLLDPNNPRFPTDNEVPEGEYADSGVQQQAKDRMADEEFRVEQLKHSIMKNGWQPVDMIFVSKLESGAYVVLEGNRRVTALRELQEKMSPDLKRSVDPLTVIEVVGTGDPAESRAQVSYLLGVRHHGSLKKWGAFARAHNIYERYLRIGGMGNDSFRWNEGYADRVADTLGITQDDVEVALRVYRVLRQLSKCPSIGEKNIKGRYYSLIREALSRRSKGLREWIKQDGSNFQLSEEGIQRMDSVCHFSTERENAPINNPQEWRALDKVLSDPDAAEKARMMKEIQDDKKRPSDVYATRVAALRQPRWDLWLKEVSELLKKVVVADLGTSDASSVCRDLAGVLDALQKKAGPREVAL